MLTILIFTILGLAIGVYLSYHDKYEKSLTLKIGEIVLNTIMGLFIGVLLAIFISIFLEDLAPIEPYVTSTDKIVALKDNSPIEGSFFLGCGIIDEGLTYCAMVECNDGTNIVEYFDAKRTYIKEVVTNYRIEHLNYCYKNNILNYFFYCRNSKNRIYIPKNSICTDYKIDME